MTDQNTLALIRTFTSSVFENTITQVDAEKSINEIHSHFKKITEITGYDTKIEHLAAVPTAKGKALGLNFAAQCLFDYKRTTQFLRAMITVIKEKQKQKPGKLIRIFYAGCGPYAPFITLVAPLFQPEEVQFSLLEINSKAVISAKKLIDSLELSDYLQDFYTADAVTFNVPEADSFDILFSETLDAVLYRECYVPILFNLLPQFNQDVVLIPENVILNVSLVTLANEDTPPREDDFGTVFNTREAIASQQHLEAIPKRFPSKELDLSNVNTEVYEKFVLDTKVHVQGDIWLYRNESSLTVPRQYMLAQPFQSSAIIFAYFIEPEIEMKYKPVK